MNTDNFLTGLTNGLDNTIKNDLNVKYLEKELKHGQ